MFGIIYTALMSLGFIGHQVKNAVKEQKNINKGIEKRRNGENFANVYTDYKGGLRSLDSGKRVRIDQLHDVEADGKDCYMRDIYGNPIRNLSEEIRNDRYIRAVKTNDPRKTVVEWKRGIPSNLTGIDGRPYYSGTEYKDLNNGRIYVCRCIPIAKEVDGSGHNKGRFYMDITTGLLVRESDSQIERRRRGSYMVSEEINKRFIDFFNSIQSTKGYINSSKNPYNIGWNEESDFMKTCRLGDYYCNKYESSDIL